VAVQPKMRSGVGIALLFRAELLLEQDLGVTAQPERNRKAQHQRAEHDRDRRQEQLGLATSVIRRTGFGKLHLANASYRPQWRAKPHSSRGTSLMPARHALSARGHTNTARRPPNPYEQLNYRSAENL